MRVGAVNVHPARSVSVVRPVVMQVSGFHGQPVVLPWGASCVSELNIAVEGVAVKGTLYPKGSSPYPTYVGMHLRRELVTSGFSPKG